MLSNTPFAYHIANFESEKWFALSKVSGVKRLNTSNFTSFYLQNISYIITDHSACDPVHHCNIATEMLSFWRIFHYW